MTHYEIADNDALYQENPARHERMVEQFPAVTEGNYDKVEGWEISRDQAGEWADTYRPIWQKGYTPDGDAIAEQAALDYDAAWLPVGEAAAQAGVKRQRISALIGRGKLVGHKRGPHTRVSRASLEAWMAARPQGPAPAAEPGAIIL